MPYSDPDSPSSSVQSSPNAPRRFLPLHILKTLLPSKQIIPTISDSDSESEDESVSLPTSYYTSPSRPEKRRHLTVPQEDLTIFTRDSSLAKLYISFRRMPSGDMYPMVQFSKPHANLLLEGRALIFGFSQIPASTPALQVLCSADMTQYACWREWITTNLQNGEVLTLAKLRTMSMTSCSLNGISSYSDPGALNP